MDTTTNVQKSNPNSIGYVYLETWMWKKTEWTGPKGLNTAGFDGWHWCGTPVRHPWVWKWLKRIEMISGRAGTLIKEKFLGFLSFPCVNRWRTGLLSTRIISSVSYDYEILMPFNPIQLVVLLYCCFFGVYGILKVVGKILQYILHLTNKLQYVLQLRYYTSPVLLDSIRSVHWGSASMGCSWHGIEAPCYRGPSLYLLIRQETAGVYGLPDTT